MASEIDSNIIKATQNSLGKYVKRPALTEKLLKKPPFRFLHDVIASVLKTTGFFVGLFDEKELLSENVKDRDSKILFLTKVITVLEYATGKSITAKPSKIVAGQEPEKTNELLQCLGEALDKSISSNDAVNKYRNKSKAEAPQGETKEKNGSKTEKPGRKITDVKKTSVSSVKLTSDKENPKDKNKAKNENSVSKSKGKELTHKKESSPKNTQQAKKNKNANINPEFFSNDKLLTEEKSNDIADNTINNEANVETNIFNEFTERVTENQSECIDSIDDSNTILKSSDENITSKHIVISRQNSKGNVDDKIAQEDVLRPTQHVDSIDSLQKKEHNNSNKLNDSLNDKPRIGNVEESNEPTKEIQNVAPNNNITKLRPQSVRPSSSRPGAPRLKEKYDNVVAETDSQLIAKVNIIVENAPNEEEEDSSIIIVDSQTDEPTARELQAESSQQSHLVQQILDSQKRFAQVNKKTEIEWQFGAHKAKEAANQEFEQLRFNIQALSRAANPLGKLLDHIQEDVEVMRQELHQWTNMHEEASKELVKQKSNNEESLFPLHTKLKQLDIDIEEKRDRINDLKIIVHKNSTRIEKLLLTGTVQ